MINSMQAALPWIVDYYLERISIRLAYLFGAFSSLFALVFILLLICCFLLWLTLPFIEISKRKILQNIYYRLEDIERQLRILNKQSEGREKQEDKKDSEEGTF